VEECCGNIGKEIFSLLRREVFRKEKAVEATIESCRA
jgi:hypothetical protein